MNREKWTNAYECTHAHAHTHKHTHTNTYKHTHTHTNAHTHTHKHTHTQWYALTRVEDLFAPSFVHQHCDELFVVSKVNLSQERHFTDKCAWLLFSRNKERKPPFN